MKYTFTLLGILFLMFPVVGEAQQSSEEAIQQRMELIQEENERRSEMLRDRTKELKHKYALVAYHHGAYLGIRSNSVSKEKAEKLGFDNPFGSYVSKVIKNTAAEKAGLRPFDYIYGIGEYRTTRQSSLTDLLSEHESGDEVTLHIVRNGKKQTMKATLGKWGDGDDDDQEEAFFGVSKMGELPKDMSGVFVSIVSNSTAEKMGLKKGDKITSINGHQILDWDDISMAIDNIPPGNDIEVAYERDNQKMTGKMPIKSHNETYDHQNIIADNDWKYEKEKKEKKYGNGAFLGVNLADMSKSKAKKLGFETPYGSYVSSVIPGTAAAKAGMKPLDYIYGVDEYRVGEEQDLGDILRKYSPGDKGNIKVVRAQKKKSIPVVFQSRDDRDHDYVKKHKTKCEDPFFGISSASESDNKGVKVNIVKNSTAKALGMQHGDVITHINDYGMADWDDIGRAIDMMSPGETIKVGFLRDGSKMSLSGEIKSYADAKKCENCDCNSDKWEMMGKTYDYDKKDIENYRETVDLSNIQVVVSDWDNASNSNALKINNLQIAANNNKGIFNMTFNLNSSGNTVVVVKNPDGRVIYEYDLGEFSGEFEDEVDMIQNGEGAYLLSVKQGDKNVKKKILIKK